MIFVTTKTPRDAGGYVQFLAAKYLEKFHKSIFVPEKTPRVAGGSVQNLKSTRRKSIFSQQLTTNYGMDLKLPQSTEFKNNE